MPVKTLGRIAAICTVLVVLWVVFLILTMAQSPTPTTQVEALSYARNRDAVYTLLYLSVTLMTVAATMLMAGLYTLGKTIAPIWAVMGLVFVPIYGTLNLVAYSSQLTLVPALIKLNGLETFTAQLIQAWPGSLMACLNNLAYAALAVPSIIFGGLLRQYHGLRWASWLLIASGAASILSTAGFMLQSSALMALTIPGGVLFLISVGLMAWHFWHTPAPVLASSS